jgi:hypothetical protein
MKTSLIMEVRVQLMLFQTFIKEVRMMTMMKKRKRNKIIVIINLEVMPKHKDKIKSLSPL